MADMPRTSPGQLAKAMESVMRLPFRVIQNRHSHPHALVISTFLATPSGSRPRGGP
jgi:hypothetical protein